MSGTDLRAKLETLLELLHEEREKAKALDMQGLQKVVQAKEALLAVLNPQPEEIVGMEDLVRRIDEENRRNAFLLWTGLNWVRELMGFFGKAAMPEVYGGGGQSQVLTRGGRLLSGKV
jgi:hypothetical protein